MIFTATNCKHNRAGNARTLNWKALMALMLVACLAIGFFTVALAQGETTLTLDLKGVTPNSADSWLSLSLTGRFDVVVDGAVAGRITANPTTEQVAAGAMDTVAIPAGAAEVSLIPVAEDFADGFVCEGTIPVTLSQGEANHKTVFAYAKRGLFSVKNVAAKDGVALGTSEFVVMNAQGVMQWSFTTDANGAYTAAQALPNGDYQLVQMRAPEGAVLLDQPQPFIVGTYFGSADSITALTVENELAPTYNGATGNLALVVSHLAAQGDRQVATLGVSGLCNGENDVPLSNYTVTIHPATLADRDGNALSAGQAVYVDTITVKRGDSAGQCSVQPLNDAGQSAGDAVVCNSGATVTLENAAGAVITYLNANGEATVPAGFVAGTADVSLRYEPVATLPTEHTAATANLEVGVSYTYQYDGTDGISKVTATSSIAPQTATLAIPDGRTELAVTATVETLADSAPVIAIAPPTQALPTETLAMAAELPMGVRVLESALPDGLKVLRTVDTDTVLFDSTLWAAGTVKIPVATGDVGAITLWVLDPQTMPVTVDEPEGDALKAAAHESRPMLDAMLGKVNSRYAHLDVKLPSAISTGKAAAALTSLLSGTVGEQADPPTASAGKLGIVLSGANAKVVYGALTDDAGAFTISGDAGETVGKLHIALPLNTMSVTTHENGAYTEENVSLPQSGYNIAFVKMSGISGTVATVEGKPIANVAIELMLNGQSVQTIATDASGAYALTGLVAGDYELHVTLPTETHAMLSAQDGVTANADGNYTMVGLTLAYGEERSLSLTANLLCGVTGTVTEGNAPVQGLAVSLADANGKTSSAQTDASGAYSFINLSAGTYQLSIQLPDHKAIVSVNGQPVQGPGTFSEQITLNAGNVKNDKLVMEATASIVGKIESLGAGQNIAAASVNAQLSTTTVQDGSFTFAGLISGDYTIYAPLTEGETLRENAQWKVTEQGNMIWITVSATAGNVYTLPDVEYVAMTSIDGVAYMDADGNAKYAQGEQLMSGVTVALQRKDGDTWTDVTNLTTDSYGHYAFANLTAGVYRVVSKAEDGVNVTAVGESVNPLGEAALGVKASTEITLNTGDTVNGISDIALSQPAKVSIGAFYDSNEDGIRGIYERSIAGITVEAVPAGDAAGTAVASAVTDNNGEASLDRLTPGDYVLRFTLPDGYLYTVNSGKWSVGYSCVGGIESVTATSDTVTLLAGQTVEAGVGAVSVGSFSGKVFNDINNNGVMDADEPGVANTKLTLTGVKTGNTYEITTDETGAYRFALLRNDTYNFTAKIPDGTLFARYTQTGGDSRSVFTSEGTDATRQFIVTDAQNVTNKNVGVIQKATLSGIAFLDSNYNGVYDEGEPPYAGVTVELVKNSNDHSMGKVVTDKDGKYTFDSLRGGDYRLRAILPNDGSIFTIVPQTAEGLYNQFAARESRRENTLPSVTVENGKTKETCVGVAMGGTITGTVFLDAKYDGTRDGSDKKASGVKIQLVAAEGTLVATDTTNANGTYTLEGIMPGEYTVRFQRRDGYAFTRYRPDDENGNHVKVLAKDGFGETEAIDVAMGQTIEHINAGMLLSSTLTGVFFNDANDNGLKDEGEGGYTDGHVRLLSSDGELDLTETVGDDGTYFFDGVMPGEYTVTYILTDNATIAKVAEGGNTLDAQGQESVLKGMKVESGKAYSAPLVGAVTLGSFEGTAYHDANGNGVHDDGEEALSGVQIAFTPKKTDMQVSEATTDSEGKFAINGMHPDDYALTLTLPDGYIFSSNLKESGITLDSAATDTVACPWAALTNRAQNAVGAVKPATIRASVWLDENRDGQQTSEERLLSGLSYELYDEAAGKVVKSAKSDDDGYVTFENVRPATYTVRFAIPDQAQPAKYENSTFEAQGAMMSHSGIAITEGQTFEDISGGLVSYTSIGGVVALDENGARTPQTGVTVTLYQGDSTDALQTVQTDDKGEYRFDGLWPDEYRLAVGLPSGTIFVRPDDPNYQAGDSVVTSTENGEGASEAFQLEMAHHLLDMNVILIKPARVGDQVWLDSNKNGLRDADEPSINGVTIQLMENGEAAYTTTSNEWGYYEFANVYPGTYTIQAQAYPELGITQSVPSLKVISSCLTSGDGNSAESDAFSVVSGSKNFDFDLGYVLLDGQTMPPAIVPGAVQNWTNVGAGGTTAK